MMNGNKKFKTWNWRQEKDTTDFIARPQWLLLGFVVLALSYDISIWKKSGFVFDS